MPLEGEYSPEEDNSNLFCKTLLANGLEPNSEIYDVGDRKLADLTIHEIASQTLAAYFRPGEAPDAALREIEQEQLFLTNSRIVERKPEVAQAIIDLKVKAANLVLSADQNAISLHEALKGFSKDVATFTEILWRQDSQSRALIETAYQDRFGISLREAITVFSTNRLGIFPASKSSKRKHQELTALLDGDWTTAAALSIDRKISNRLNRDIEGIADVLKKACGEDPVFGYGELSHKYQSLFSTLNKVKTIDGAIKSLGKYKSGYLEAIVIGREAKQVGALLASELRPRIFGSPDMIKIAGILGRCSDAGEVREAIGVFEELSGKNFKEASNALKPSYTIVQKVGRIFSKKQKESLKEYILKLVASDSENAEPWLLRSRLLREEPGWIGLHFVDKTPDQREVLVQRYQAQFCEKGETFSSHVREIWAKGGSAQEQSDEIIELSSTGTLPPYQVLRDCLRGFGADETSALWQLKQLSKDEFEEAKILYSNDYRQKTCWQCGTFIGSVVYLYNLVTTTWNHILADDDTVTFKQRFNENFTIGRDLEKDLQSKLHGEFKFEYRQWSESLENPDRESIDTYRALHQFSRAGSCTGLVNKLSKVAVSIDRDKKLIEELTARQDLLNPEEQVRLEHLITLAQNGYPSLQSSTYAFSEVAANLVSVGLASIATPYVLSEGASLATYGSAVVSIYGISLLGRVIPRLLLSGHQATGWKRWKLAASWSFADAASLGMGRALKIFGPKVVKLARTPLGKKIVKGVTKAGIKHFVKSFKTADQNRQCQFVAYKRGNMGQEESWTFDRLLREATLYA